MKKSICAVLLAAAAFTSAGAQANAEIMTFVCGQSVVRVIPDAYNNVAAIQVNNFTYSESATVEREVVKGQLVTWFDGQQGPFHVTIGIWEDNDVHANIAKGKNIIWRERCRYVM